MIKSVVVHETRGNIEEIDIDLLPEKNEIANLLGGNATFRQWEDDLGSSYWYGEHGKFRIERE